MDLGQGCECGWLVWMTQIWEYLYNRPAMPYEFFYAAMERKEMLAPVGSVLGIFFKIEITVYISSKCAGQYRRGVMR